jgi:Lon protease-like protein
VIAGVGVGVGVGVGIGIGDVTRSLCTCSQDTFFRARTVKLPNLTYGFGVPTAGSADSNLGLLPLFPLSTVFVPGMVLPLRIFESRYRQLIVDLKSQPQNRRCFGIVAIKDGWEVGEQAARTLYPVGTKAQLQQVTDLPEGEYFITVLGGPRFQLEDVDTESRSYLTASVTDLPDDSGVCAPELVETAQALLLEYRGVTQGWLGGNDAGLPVPNDPVDLSYAITSSVLLEVRERQSLLQCSDACSRLELGIDFMRREITLAEQLPSVPAPQMMQVTHSTN